MLPRFLCGQAVGSRFRHPKASTDPIFASHQLLRPGLAWQKMDVACAGVVHRQPAQRCSRQAVQNLNLMYGLRTDGCSEIVIKLGGAALEDKNTLQSALAPSLNWRRRHKVTVVHGGGAALTRT